MRWIRYRIKTTTQAEDLLISELYDAGYEGAQIEDNVQLTPLEKEQMFVDILPVVDTDDGTAYVSVYVEESFPDAISSDEAGTGDDTEAGGGAEDDMGSDAIKRDLARIRQAIADTRDYGIDVGDGSIAVSVTEDLDWINNWKQYFHQFYIDDLLVTPSWEAVPEAAEGRMVLHIDPGTAFGTGMHETTQLCIRQIRKYLTSDARLLDVGTGSGILGILALMYGAARVTATDLDGNAVDAVADNLARNPVDADRFHLIIGNIISDAAVQDETGYGVYDIAVANILADVLVPLTPQIPRHLREGGIYITSGIIEGKEEEVAEAMRSSGFEIVDITAQGEWRCVVGRRGSI